MCIGVSGVRFAAEGTCRSLVCSCYPLVLSSAGPLVRLLERLRLLIFVLGLARQAVVKVSLGSITHGLGLQSARVEKGYMSFGEYTAFNVAGES